MIRQLVALFAFVALAEASAMDNVGLKLVHEQAMVSTFPNNFGLCDPALAQMQWKTVSINGPEATIYTPTCERVVKPVSEFTQIELDLLNKTKFDADMSRPKERTSILLAESGIFKIGSDNVYLLPGTNPNDARFRRGDGVLAQKIDARNYSVQKAGLANNLDGIYVNKDLVSFVYNDNKVIMKPLACLETDELELVEQLNAEVPK